MESKEVEILGMSVCDNLKRIFLKFQEVVTGSHFNLDSPNERNFKGTLQSDFKKKCI